jgi:thymidine kinase
MSNLYFYYSTMSAGKSALLLQSAHNYTAQGLRPLLLTPAVNTRDGQGVIRSRTGLEQPALVIGPDDCPYQIVVEDAGKNGTPACVLVDEAQFLSPDQVHRLTDIVDLMDVPVLAYGLRTDFRGELFPGSAQLLAWADRLCEVKTICTSGRKATMSLRLDAQGQTVFDGPQVFVGGNDRYIPVSRSEFKKQAVASGFLSRPE